MIRWALPVLLASACARAPAAPSWPSLARPGAAWPANVPACAIDRGWDSMCAPSFDVRDPSGAKIARVEKSTYVHVRWSQLPVIGGARVAHVEASAGGLTIAGSASIAEQAFVVHRSIEIAGNHARIPAGSRVSILGTSGSSIVVEVATGFTAPTRVEVGAPCEAFGLASVETVAAGPPFALPNDRTLALHTTPGGPVAFSFTPDAKDAWVWLGTDGDFVHVAGGHIPWRTNTDRTSFVFDGWVRASSVKRVEEIERDWDSGCEPMDLVDSCGHKHAARDAVVRSSPKGPAIGSIAHGSPVDVLEKRDGFTSFRLPNQEIVGAFFLADEDLAAECQDVDPDDGCPCP